MTREKNKYFKRLAATEISQMTLQEIHDLEDLLYRYWKEVRVIQAYRKLQERKMREE